MEAKRRIVTITVEDNEDTFKQCVDEFLDSVSTDLIDVQFSTCAYRSPYEEPTIVYSAMVMYYEHEEEI